MVECVGNHEPAQQRIPLMHNIVDLQQLNLSSMALKILAEEMDNWVRDLQTLHPLLVMILLLLFASIVCSFDFRWPHILRFLDFISPDSLEIQNP